ncbi:unnamed protein product [Mucor hiemalis]
MSYSTTVENKETGKQLQLLLDNNQLIITEKQQTENQAEGGSTVETKETVDLEFIYGVNYINEILDIHLVEKATIEENEGSSKKTLTNIRPQDEKWNLRTLRFAAVDDTLSPFITRLSESALPRRDEFLSTKVHVVLNPTSGLQLAETHWKTIVKPMLIKAGFDESNINQIMTQSNGKTRNLAESLGKSILQETSSVPIIISMGGDGTLHEIVNGLKDVEGVGHFRLGVIPSGSGNAFALGLNIENVELATLKIIKGQKEEPFYLMDVKFGHSNSISTEKWHENIQYDQTKKPFRLLVVLSWGFHAQIVSKARYLRYFMGNKRFSVVAMFLLKFLQQYEGELILKNARKYDPESKLFVESEKDIVLDGNQPNKGFTYFIVSKQHSLEKGFKIASFASSLTNDMDVVVLRGADVDALTKASMKAFQGGTHVESKNVEYFKTTDLLLRVKHKAELCLDGEIHDLPAQGIVHLKVIGSSSTESTFTVFV